MSSSILIVDDEQDILDLLDYNVRRAGFTTLLAATGGEALVLAKTDQPAAIILDVMLPDLDGLEVLRRLRQDPATKEIPIMLLTAKGEEIDRVQGFEIGADDYVVKPFSIREVVLRVRALLRRGVSEEPAKLLKVGYLLIDRDAHRIFWKQDELILTALEFKLITTLLERRGRVQTRERLLEDVWGMSPDVTTRTVDTHIKRLREKLGDAGVFVETVRGVGYRFAEIPE
jgi:two-component system, OmpR family, phosphate regulon response regulator PhoB